MIMRVKTPYTQRKIEGSTVVPKICYGQILKGIEKLKADNELDIKENPTATRVGYKPSIDRLIRRVMGENRVNCPNHIPDLVMEYLCKKGIIVRYCGNDYQFPGTKLETPEEIVAKTKAALSKLDMPLE